MTRRHVVVLSALVAGLMGSNTLSGQQPATGTPERDFLSRIRRLTVEGRRAGEGYWAPDGKSLVFQSEREPGNPFYQIYRLDLLSLIHISEPTRLLSISYAVF